VKEYHEWDSIQAVTPTICSLLGISPPALSANLPLVDVLRIARTVFNDAIVEKCLVFAPDALGNHLYSQYPALFREVVSLAPIEVSLQSVMPAKTPVCFASMFTGATPEQHGIRKYERPVLQCDTLFDALTRVGKRVAIVAVRNCSIDLIFRGRDITYYSESYDPNVTERVISLLEADQYDFILAYHQEYDDVMHATAPFAAEAMQAAKNNIAGFVQITKAFDEHWGRYNRMIVFTPDHGAHISSATGKGDHGEDISEDMELKHFYGFRRSREL
jgi:hypothetical protein